MEDKNMLEKRFKMRTINDTRNSLNILKEIKLFENVFDNNDMNEFEEDKHINEKIISNQSNISLQGNYVIIFRFKFLNKF